jgi:hypothetical protein
MKTYLRNKITGFYFQGVADWTPFLDNAFNFPSPEKAARFVHAAHLNANDMEIVFAFGNPAYNLALPVDERFELLPISNNRPAAHQPLASHV